MWILGFSQMMIEAHKKNPRSSKEDLVKKTGLRGISAAAVVGFLLKGPKGWKQEKRNGLCMSKLRFQVLPTLGWKQDRKNAQCAMH